MHLRLSVTLSVLFCSSATLLAVLCTYWLNCASRPAMLVRCACCAVSYSIAILTCLSHLLSPLDQGRLKSARTTLPALARKLSSLSRAKSQSSPARRMCKVRTMWLNLIAMTNRYFSKSNLNQARVLPEGSSWRNQ